MVLFVGGLMRSYCLKYVCSWRSLGRHSWNHFQEDENSVSDFLLAFPSFLKNYLSSLRSQIHEIAACVSIFWLVLCHH